MAAHNLNAARAPKCSSARGTRDNRTQSILLVETRYPYNVRYPAAFELIPNHRRTITAANFESHVAIMHLHPQWYSPYLARAAISRAPAAPVPRSGQSGRWCSTA